MTTPQKPTPGDTVSLREYIERILDEREKAYHARLDATASTADMMARDLERRLEGLNHSHAEVVRNRGMFLDRKEFAVMHEAMERRVAAIERWNAKVIGVGLVLITLSGVLSAAIVVWMNWIKT